MKTKLNRRRLLCLVSASSLSLLGGRWGSASGLTRTEQELLGLVRHPEIPENALQLRTDAARAFDAMRGRAREDGVEIAVHSAHRSFSRQSEIWNRKFKRLARDYPDPREVIRRILSRSALPGTSRHHWGTDLDLVDALPEQPPNALSTEHFLEGGAYRRLYEWLLRHAAAYGFHEVYTNDPDRSGFEYEPWQWSFAELSVPLLARHHALPLHEKLPLRKLEGRECLTRTFLENYQRKWGLGVNPRLLPASLRA